MPIIFYIFWIYIMYLPSSINFCRTLWSSQFYSMANSQLRKPGIIKSFKALLHETNPLHVTNNICFWDGNERLPTIYYEPCGHFDRLFKGNLGYCSPKINHDPMFHALRHQVAKCKLLIAAGGCRSVILKKEKFPHRKLCLIPTLD